MRLLAKLLAFGALASLAIAGATAAIAGSYHVEYSFQGGADAAFPVGTLANIGGKLYGTGAYGGANGLGAVYVFARATGAETVVYSFKSGGDGAAPRGRMVEVGGILYGTTELGGGSTNCGGNGCGVVFSLDPTTGVERVVYAFKGGGDGDDPVSGLIRVGGKLYGTTRSGGLQVADCPSGCGTLFSIDPTTGAETLVHAFSVDIDGEGPEAGLVDVNGRLYGTTDFGGPDTIGPPGCGTVFSFDPKTGAEAMVYAFKGGADGCTAGGISTVGGLLYGATGEGGGFMNRCGNGCGTIFSLDPATGVEKVLYAFKGGHDGSSPYSAPIAVAGSLYDTTLLGGAHTHGTLFSLNLTTGLKTNLHAFQGGADGALPAADMLYVRSQLYGTTAEGGVTSNGTVFALRP